MPTPPNSGPRTYPTLVTERIGAGGRIKIILTPEGDDQLIDFSGGEDYTPETIGTVKTFAIGTILEGKSTYQINQDISNETGAPLRSSDGIPLAISDEAPGGNPDKVFLAGSSPQKSYFINISEGNIFNENGVYSKITNRAIPIDPDQSPAVNKGITIGGGLNYIEQINRQNSENNSELVKRLGQKLVSVNTFYETFETDGTQNKYVIRGTLEDSSNVGRARLQTTLGAYNKTNRIGDDSTGNDSTILVQKDFQAMGLQMPLKASGEYYIPKFGPNQSDDDPALQILAARAAALAPGVARLGIRIPVGQMQTFDVLNNDFNGVLKSNKKITDAEDIFPDLSSGEEVISYGSYYNWIAPFDGIERILQMPAITIMLVAEALVFSAVAEILQGLRGSDKYSDRFRAGFLAFFGLQGGDGAYTDFGRFTLAVLGAITSPTLFNATGWYSTATRSIIRIVFSEISRGVFAFAGALNAGGSTGVFNRTGIDIYSDGLQGDVIGAAARIIELFMNSRIISMTDMFANIGTTIVSPLGESFVPYKQGAGRNPFKALTPNQPSYIDNIIDAQVGIGGIDDSGFSSANTMQNGTPLANVLIKKDRLKRNYGLGQIGKRPLAWGTSTTPSKFLLPENIQFAASIAGGDPGAAKIADLKNLGAVSTETNRFTPEEVNAFESQLEASYMPFYIQDLRTNEIISFHAFISTMQDSFSANYNTSTPIGRIEPIHTYKDSNRDMSISFTLLATNQEDHSVMWWKINKLITLVYPQFTKGRQLTTTETVDGNQETLQFTQPFSQIAGAAPMVRLRVGDVWKTNYSRFNVMRLFGVGNNFNLTGSSGGIEETEYNAARDSNKTRADRIASSIYDATKRIKEGNFIAGNQNDGDQIIIDFHPAINDRVFGILPGGSLNFFNNNLNVWGVAKDLNTPNLPPGKYKFKITEVVVPTATLVPTDQTLVRTYKLRRVDDTDDTGTYILRYPDPELLLASRRTGNSFDELANNFTLFGENDLRQQIEVANAAYNLSLDIDYEYLRNRAIVEAGDAQNLDTINTLKTKIQNFFKYDANDLATSNPIISSFESVSGKGIAGFIGSIGLDWNESRWETEWNSARYNSRAPMMIKIDIKFMPVHDITPGLDSNGFIRAPVYPVGRYAGGLNEIETVDNQKVVAYNEDVKTVIRQGIPNSGGSTSGGLL